MGGYRLKKRKLGGYDYDPLQELDKNVKKVKKIYKKHARLPEY